ncbi:T9SS type A sorting domain-containing protein [Aquimarina algiphila]|uniref:T9SS type A sorting domain-containing protein n=1 Tax=Aquimarina algiphila TaxID=2047982 RepID=UPI00248FD39F|nr:T9SS type A sorting domain-containing protein [Aquimarina algiphila]
MKTRLLYVALLCFSFSTYAQYTAIPDPNFETALNAYDDIANDNQVPTANIASLTTLDISNSNISDLTGIEDFVSLETLQVHDNNISTINLSTLVNLITFRATRNQLTALDVSNQPALESLIVDGNLIETLSINSTVLKILQITGNELTTLDTSGFPLLRQLFVGGNDVDSLDLSLNPALDRLECQRTNIVFLDLSMLPNLENVRAFNTNLKFLNVKNGNNTTIQQFEVHNNPDLECIQVDNAADANAGLNNYVGWQIDGATSSYANQCLTNVPDDNFEQALIDAGYDSGPLDNFVPTANIASVESFNAGTGGALYNKGITDLTGIEDFASLMQLWSEGNPIENIDVSENINLEILTFINSELGGLDLTSNTKLKRVAVGNCPLANINVTSNTMMTHIVIWNTILSSIDISANTAMTNLSISDSPISSIDLSTNTALERLSLNNTQLTSIDISNNTLLIDLKLDTNPIAGLDLTTNTALTSLSVENNQFTSIDLSNNILLTELECNNSQLTSLDLRTNTELIELYCNNNTLTSLDLSANDKIEYVEINDNQLTFLNLKNGTNETADLDFLTAIGNPDLRCIQVDNATAANAGTGSYSGWIKDATASYSEMCTDCAVDGVTISSQAELDAFITTLGSCNTVNGNLIIRRANDVTDLSGLAGIEVINGFLNIGDSDMITNLTGLENLHTVTEKIAVFRNDALNDITALSGITNPVKRLFVYDNVMLTDISTVLNFTITETLNIRDLTLSHALVFSNITTLTGLNSPIDRPGSVTFQDLIVPGSGISLPNLAYIENVFTMRNVEATTTSFPLLTEVGLSFSISNVNSTVFNFDSVETLGNFFLDRTSLIDLSPFATVTSIGGQVTIQNNPNLTNLEAFSNVSAAEVSLTVDGNVSLTSLNGLEFISGTIGLITIERNSVLTNIDALRSITSTRYFRIRDNLILDNVDGLQNLTETTETDMGAFLQSTISGNAITSLNLTSLRTVANRFNIVETGVTNFCGLYPYVTNGDGQTTLNLTGSSFTISDVLTCEDVFSCPLYSLPSDNFTIEAVSETCMDKNNGIISISATEPLNYIATINDKVYTFTSNMVIPDLAPDTYSFCIAVDGITDCEQCFELLIEEAETLEGKTSIQTDAIGKKVVVDITSGTAPYTVTINDEVVGAYNVNTFSLDVDQSGLIEIHSSLACEGKLSTNIERFNTITAYPNPTLSDVELTLPYRIADNSIIEIHNALGMIVSSGVYKTTANKVKISMEDMPVGIYFVRIHGATSQPLKIVKQ